MGNAAKTPQSVKEQLASARHRTEDRVGKAKVTGRYHLHPRKVTDDYIIEDTVLGTGMNGEVVLGRHRVTGQEVAIKPYTSVGIKKEEQRVLRNEVEVFLGMDHPHIARLLNVYEDVDKLHLVMEVCKGGDILCWIRKYARLNEAKTADLLYQMLLAVSYMHDLNIVHRDIKLDNFLFETTACDYVKLVDFGMSRYWTNNKKMKLACGTVSYIAPECLAGSYDLKCDVWSLGVIAFVLLSGSMPFAGTEAEQTSLVKEGHYSMEDDAWAKVSQDGKDFVRALMTKDPETRLMASRAISHPWIAARRSRSTIVEAEPVSDEIVQSLQRFANASAFRKVCFTMMSYSMSIEERKAVREAFMAIDVDHTGRIQASELKEVLSRYVSDEEARKVFQNLDTNSNEAIDYSDFLGAMMTSNIAQNEAHIRAAFNRFDKDCTGTISMMDLQAVLGSSHHGEEVATLMGEADFDSDGEISYDEFMAYMQGENAKTHEQEALLRVVENSKAAAPAPKPDVDPANIERATAKAGSCVCTLS